MKLRRLGIVIAALPSLFMLSVFYSLAIHMRRSLGKWPTSIGTNGFSNSLAVHGELAWDLCLCLCLATICATPVGIVITLLIARWRSFAAYFGFQAVFFALSWGLMLLAPSGFLNWWWD